MNLHDQILNLCHEQQYAKAMGHAIQWTEAEPENAAAWSARTFAHEGLGQSEEAMFSVNRAIQFSKGDPAHFLHRGQLSFDSNKLSESAADFEQAATLAEQSSHAYKDSAVLGHAVVLAKLGLYQRAKERASLCHDETRMWVGEPIHGAQFKTKLNAVD